MCSYVRNAPLRTLTAIGGSPEPETVKCGGRPSPAQAKSQTRLSGVVGTSRSTCACTGPSQEQCTCNQRHVTANGTGTPAFVCWKNSTRETQTRDISNSCANCSLP